MNRRQAIAGLGAAAAWPLRARGQQRGLVRRVGVMMSLAERDPETPSLMAAFTQGLAQAGWNVGHDLRINYHWGTGGADVTGAAALLSLAPDVIVADGVRELSALRGAARKVPVVFMEISEPVFYGFVDSLEHPGGNMTGFTGLDPATGAKWLELLAEITPRIARVAVVFNSATAPRAALFSLAAEGAAQKFAIEVARSPIYTAADIEAVMTMLARERPSGLIFPVDAFTDAHRNLIIGLAARDNLPAIYGVRTIVTAGGLASYGIDLASQFRQAAGYVDRILRGEKPADLPVRPPTKSELVINLKTAKALGVTFPPGVLAIADEVIE